MCGEAAKIVLREKQQVILQQFAKAPTASVQHAQRATIILEAFEGTLNRDVAALARRKISSSTFTRPFKPIPRQVGCSSWVT